MPSLLDISEKDLKSLPREFQLQIKSFLAIKQALYDILGDYPADNVLPYWYQSVNNSANNNQIAANGTGQNSIKISADSAFIAMSVRGASTGDYTCLVRQDASDRQMMNQQVHSSALMGTAERPGPLHKPLLLPANTTISLDFTDLSGNANDIYLSWVGFKVYNRQLG
jgi:hypothetical protein